jgi:heme ABC exporter ATP-binding subunit CcmA
MEPVVHLRSAVSVLGRFPALAGVDLDVFAGEIVHLQGPNGAGKTTLLRTCAGLVPVVSGEAVVLGHDLRRDRKSVRRQVGLVGHDTFLYDDLTVADNVVVWTRAVRADPADGEAALRELGLDGRLRDVAVANLSAGQRRRTSFAAMLARRPHLWLLDEPHAGLDQAGRDLVDGLIHQAVHAGATVLIASHEIERAQGLGGRSVELAGGTIQPDARGDAGGAAGPPTPSTGTEPTEPAGSPSADPAEHPEVAGVA